MAHTFPHSRTPTVHEELSLPATLTHKQLDRTPFAIRGSSKDRDYLPDASRTQSLSSASESFG